MANTCPRCNADNPDTLKFCGECGTHLRPSKSIPDATKTIETPVEEYPRGSTFAVRYTIIEKLGTGGMGAVYRVEDTNIGQDIALKLIKPDIASDKKTIERFRNELKTTRMISHRNVCRMFDLAETETTYYITMEYVPGEDLKSFIRRSGKLDVPKAISIAKEICDGLSEAHRLGVVHRDLKSNNIMIDKEGNARIMDFGIAWSHRAEGLTGEGIIIGTPEYMSPEQAEAKEVDHRSDIYSLGVILYEMVTGELPFKGDTPLSIAVKHKTKSPPCPKDLNAQIPDDLNFLILKCLEKRKETRYKSAGEMHSELDRIEKGIPSKQREISKRKPLTSKEITVTFGLKKLLIPALIVVALVITGVILWRPWSEKVVAPIPSAKPSIAVMYFENNTGDENLDHWRKALSDLLIADLSQSKYLTVLSGESLFNILRRMDRLEAKSYALEDLKEVAAQGRTENVLVGKYAKAGDRFRMNAMLQNPITGEVIGSEMIEGTGEESFFSMVDELTRKIKANFNLSKEQIASDIDREIGKITTSLPEAYRYYSEGIKYGRQGDYQKSMESLKRAVVIDPEFAMAFRSIGIGYGNVGDDEQREKYFRKALELSDRVSDRERLIIQGQFFAYSESTYDKAIEAINELIELYPEDVLGNMTLGVLNLWIEEWDKAIKGLEVAIHNRITSFITYQRISRAYRAKGMYDKAREILEDYLNNFSDIADSHYYLALNYLCQGEYDSAFVEADKAIFLNPALPLSRRIKGDIYHCRGDLIKAREEHQKLLEAKEPRVRIDGRRRLGVLFLFQGKFEESINQFRLGMELAEEVGNLRWKRWFHLGISYVYLRLGIPEKSLKECDEVRRVAFGTEDVEMHVAALHRKGLIYVEMNSIAEALRVAEELKVLIEKSVYRKRMRFYYHLMGMIELKMNNLSKAIEDFKEAISLLSFQYSITSFHALFIDALALAYFQSGDLERAHAGYERITILTTGKFDFGDIYAKAFYMLGKIHEQQGDTAKAIENYEKFLELWKDADPGIVEVEDAKKRLAGLLSQ